MAGFNHFPQIAAALKPACQKAVTNTTLSLKDGVQANAPVLTGFMRDSTYAVTPDGTSTYGQATPPTDDVYLLPEVKPDNDMTGIVGVAANYGIYQEMGTRFMAAQPYFYPAVEAARAVLDAELAKVEASLRGSIT